MGKRRSARELALKVLFQVDVGKLPIDEVLGNAAELDDTEVSEFAECLVAGAATHREALDEIIARYASGWALDRMANVDRNLLRLALYEILFLDDIPASVSINEAVELGKTYSTAESGRFINGILGNFVRQGEAETLRQAQVETAEPAAETGPPAPAEPES